MLFLLPFFYFLTTRLRSWRAAAFHFAYEAVPPIVLCIYYKAGLLDLLMGYLAFISVYEIGYAYNDHLSHTREGERTRHKPLILRQWIFFIAVRLGVFVGITQVLEKSTSLQWYTWFGALAAIFFTHNRLRSNSLKCVTFVFLSWFRFMSPLLPVLEGMLIFNLALPVLLNYSLFRLFIYMDSKDLLKNMDRKSPSFLIGFYLVNLVFSVPQWLFSFSYLPILFSAYCLVLAVLMSRALSQQEETRQSI